MVAPCLRIKCSAFGLSPRSRNCEEIFVNRHGEELQPQASLILPTPQESTPQVTRVLKIIPALWWGGATTLKLAVIARNCNCKPR